MAPRPAAGGHAPPRPACAAEIPHQRLPYSAPRFLSLLHVYRGCVLFDNGLVGGRSGYVGDEHLRRDSVELDQVALFELWKAAMIDVDATQVFAPDGHRVTITRAGEELLGRWSRAGEARTA
ncbi:hypothetical protein HUO13_33810 [Saccharopolyspora erythraea]|uniref:hypothetical protein n=1 Tax=Saccharopolyspora erythraea TaxID=1836 RepID=UPI001BA4F765|nr:hypothetical protein [Saccharopolyspora erythraea]QUH05092.1 hypothetical protein HUO13_33810 [Saccharopolyspora erythraea]